MMSDGVNFTKLPLWEAMNFTHDCKAWGHWYTTFIAPSHWNSSEFLDGDAQAVLRYFISSLPDPQRGELPPVDSTDALELIDPGFLGYILDWYGSNL